MHRMFCTGTLLKCLLLCFPIASIQETLALIISSLTFETYFISSENRINEKWDDRKLKTIFAYKECQGFWNRNADSLEYKIIKLCLNGTWLCREDTQLSLWFPKWTFLEVWLFTPNRPILSVICTEGLLCARNWSDSLGESSEWMGSPFSHGSDFLVGRQSAGKQLGKEWGVTEVQDLVLLFFFF